MVRESRLVAAVLIAAATGFSCAARAHAQRSTDPSKFTQIVEEPVFGNYRALTAGTNEVDNRSLIRIVFDASKMALPEPLVVGGSPVPKVHLRVEAFAHEGSSMIPIAPIPYYVAETPSAPAGSPAVGGSGSGAHSGQSTSSGSLQYTYYEKYFNPSIHAIPPSTYIELRGSPFAKADYIRIDVVNLETLESLDVTVVPEQFGFRTSTTDTVMFVRRLGITSADLKAGLDQVNFAPTPGVAYGGIYIARGHGLRRLLSPGIGMNVLFLTWSDPAFDLATGQFTSGTKESNIQIGMGIQGSLFSGVLQFTYGWNLNAQEKRAYVGIGISFVNLASKLGDLTAR